MRIIIPEIIKDILIITISLVILTTEIIFRQETKIVIKEITKVFLTINKVFQKLLILIFIYLSFNFFVEIPKLLSLIHIY